MKKNILSIIILALLLVNIVLTSVMMFSVTSTNKKVATLVGNIITVMNLELTEPGEENKTPEVSLADTEVYSIAETMTIPLAPEQGGDGSAKQSYLQCNISFSMDKKNKGYKTYGSAEKMAGNAELIKDAVNTTVSRHTASELQADAGLENLKAEILQAVQDLFQSDFIYNVSISQVVYG